MSRHRSPRPRLPWWVHMIVLTLIIGSTAVSVVTGNPLFAYVGCPSGCALGSVLGTPRGRAALRSAVHNRVVWLVVAGLAFATVAASVAALAVTR